MKFNSVFDLVAEAAKLTIGSTNKPVITQAFRDAYVELCINEGVHICHYADQVPVTHTTPYAWKRKYLAANKTESETNADCQEAYDASDADESGYQNVVSISPLEMLKEHVIETQKLLLEKRAIFALATSKEDLDIRITSDSELVIDYTEVGQFDTQQDCISKLSYILHRAQELKDATTN